ncbi:MAG: DUF1499 domain-containing protein [Halieaceae bacterium]
MTDTANSSKLITLFGRMGLVFLLLVPISVAAVRFGLHFSIGLPIFALACLASLLVIIALVICSLLPRYREQRRTALLWTLPALPPVLLIFVVMSAGSGVPPIHDITTDTDDPPLFDAGVHYRPDDSNSIDIKPEVIAIQLEAYPDLATIVTDMTPEQAFERASNVAESLEWVIYNSDPQIGVIEASYTSMWFGFVDDIVIRVQRTPAGTAVDLRSVSRVGRSDLGANAARIRAFIQRF